MTLDDRKKVSLIQALRAFSIMWVVLNHAFPKALPGGFVGVDVFFVISGFLISLHLLDQVEAGNFSFIKFYLRRARRLLPASLTVLVVTALASIWLLPPAWLASTLSGIGAAALYVVNWWLAATSVDYFADSGVISPVNHFWSLSVEEQFYLVWPALIWIAWIARKRISGLRTRLSFAQWLAIILAFIALVSFSNAVWDTAQGIPAAYFYTHGRAWEFALGGLAGVLTRTGIPLPRYLMGRISFSICWAVLIASGWAIDPTSDIPGFAALPIVLATALLLIIGDSHGSKTAKTILNINPIQWLGDVSYSAYLWHWPILVLAPFALAVEDLNTSQIWAALLLTGLLADVSKKQIEDRFRSPSQYIWPGQKQFSHSVQLLFFGALSILIGCATLSVASDANAKSASVSQTLFDLSQNPKACFGARATEPGSDCPSSHILADKYFALQNWTSQIVQHSNQVGHDCQTDQGDDTVKICGFGAPEDTATRRIALIGDSHAGMWMSALGQFVEDDGIRVITFIASSCPATDATDSFAYYLPADMREACLTWRAEATKAIISDPNIDMVVTSSSAYNIRKLTPSGWAEEDGAGYAALWRRFISAGKTVVVIDDAPLLRAHLPECLARPHPEFAPCSRPAAEVPEISPMESAVNMMEPNEVRFLRLRDVFCDQTTCHSIIGGIPVYMDSDHISAPFARSLASRIRPLVTPPE